MDTEIYEQLLNNIDELKDIELDLYHNANKKREREWRQARVSGIRALKTWLINKYKSEQRNNNVHKTTHYIL